MSLLGASPLPSDCQQKRPCSAAENLGVQIYFDCCFLRAPALGSFSLFVLICIIFALCFGIIYLCIGHILLFLAFFQVHLYP